MEKCGKNKMRTNKDKAEKKEKTVVEKTKVI